MKLGNTKRILIIGDAGRGKTMLAQKLAKKLNIPAYSMDDISWIKKIFTKARNGNKY